MRHFKRFKNMFDRLKIKLKKYIKNNYVQEEPKICYDCLKAEAVKPARLEKSYKQCASIDNFINLVKDKQTFSEYLLALIDESGESDADVYNRAGIDRRLFSKIRSNNNYQPSKNTIFALAMALKLDHTKTSRLLNKAGYEFSNNKLTDIIIMFCIENNIYDLYKIDSFLMEYKQKPIASEM